MRCVWARVGERPQTRQHRGYEWTYVYGFVRPDTGEVVFFLLPRLNKFAFEAALVEFAAMVGAGPDKRVVLVLDGAGAHQKVSVPDGLHLVFQPAYSPELQPSERLWPLLREALANRLFETIEAVEEALIARCQAVSAMRETVRRLTSFSWWLDALRAAGVSS